ncbi:MAG: hypothetical protein EA350_04100 [Gemmatimonadales bacterium]|nr:MAG: hypothetical protein EA350_04100 [Gemmatimonadales bacterium]
MKKSTPLPAWRERVELLDVVLVVTPNGGSEVTVHLGVPGGERFIGQGAGLGHREGTMRAAVDATLRALTPLCDGRLRLELRGVRSMRAFDALLMIVALTATVVSDPDSDGDSIPGGDRYRLIGTVAAPEEDLVRGTVMAVLDAANRVVEGYALIPEARSGAPVEPAVTGDPVA